MEKRVCNSIVIGIVLFLVILLIKNHELFTTDSPSSLNNLKQVLNDGQDELLRLENYLEQQQAQLETFIKTNNDLIQQIKVQHDAHQSLINRNNNLVDQVISNVSALAKKRGIKNIQQVVDNLIKRM
jgi:peptidoglycan hydrolase CwlO-like protein